MLFPAVWLVGWAFGEAAVLGHLFGHGDASGKDASLLFTGVWLIGWTAGGGIAAYTWLWMFGGREVVVLRADVLEIRRELWGFGRSREYDLQRVKNLRVSQVWKGRDGSGAWGGPITFDYGSQTVRIGSGVEESEAREIVQELSASHDFHE